MRRYLIALAVAVLLLLGAAATVLLGRLADANEWLLHTREVQLVLARAQALLSEAETAQRGYLLTADPRFLEPLRTAEPQLRSLVTGIAGLTRDNPRQQDRVGPLREAVDARLAALDEVLRLATAGRRDEAVQQVRSGPGSEHMRRTRGLLGDMAGEEARLLDERLRTVRQEERAAQWMLLALMAASVVLLVGLHLGLSRGEARLRTSERLTRSLVDNAPALVRVQASGGETMLSNRGWRRAQADEPALVGPLEGPLAGLEADAARTDRAVEQRLSIPSGGERGPTYLHGIAFPVRGDHEDAIGVASIVLDVTAMEQARIDLERLTRTLEEQVLQRTARLSEANDQLEAFSYMVSHDLRAPLRAMRGFAQALQEDSAAHLDESGRRFLARIAAAAARMDTLIDDLLSYSRLSRSELPLGPAALGPAVTAALQPLQGALSAAGATVAVDEPLPVAFGNATVLEQVIQNLVSNAAKFVAPDVTPRIRIRAEPSAEGTVRLAVEDNGIGIAPADLERIFQPFERLHGVERYTGTGIGLAIVRKGVERLGGRVGVRSQPGQGSVFWFELPRAPAADLS